MAISEQLLGTIIGGIFALLGALIGGMFCLLGNKYASSKQKEKEKRKILINYYVFLKKYFILIKAADEGNLNNLYAIISEYKEQMENNVFKFYITEEYIRYEKEFSKNISNELEKKDITKHEIKKNIIKEFEKILGKVEQRIKEV